MPLALDDETATVRAVLGALAVECPGVIDRVLDERGDLRRHVNLFLGADNVRSLDALDTKVLGAAELTILPAVSGG